MSAVSVEETIIIVRGNAIFFMMKRDGQKNAKNGAKSVTAATLRLQSML